MLEDVLVVQEDELGQTVSHWVVDAELVVVPLWVLPATIESCPSKPRMSKCITSIGFFVTLFLATSTYRPYEPEVKMFRMFFAQLESVRHCTETISVIYDTAGAANDSTPL